MGVLWGFCKIPNQKEVRKNQVKIIRVMSNDLYWSSWKIALVLSEEWTEVCDRGERTREAFSGVFLLNLRLSLVNPSLNNQTLVFFSGSLAC